MASYWLLKEVYHRDADQCLLVKIQKNTKETIQSEFTPNSCEIIIKNCQTSKQQTQLILSTTIIDAGLLILLIARILNDFSHF